MAKSHLKLVAPTEVNRTVTPTRRPNAELRTAVWFAMDAKGAAGTDAAALQARQEYLVNLAGQRCAPQQSPQPRR